jgi:hypothetical protein
MRDAMMILASNKRYNGIVTIVRLNGSVEGVMIAAAINIMTKA